MSGDELAIHQFVTGAVHATVADQDIHLELAADYPVSGEVEIRVVAGAGDWTLGLRVPSWCEGATAQVGGQPVAVATDAGKVSISRTWAGGDMVTLSLPKPARFTWPDPRIDAVRGQAAVERGPLVRCLESVGFGADVEEAVIDVAAGVQLVEGDVVATIARLSVEEQPWAYSADPYEGVSKGEPRQVRLQAYRNWGNRGAGTMRMFLPTA